MPKSKAAEKKPEKKSKGKITEEAPREAKAVNEDDEEEAAAVAKSSSGGGNEAALAAASGEVSVSLKNFRQHPDMESFYRFIYENDLRMEAMALIDDLLAVKISRTPVKKK